MNSLRELCLLNGTSGDEERTAEYIVGEIKDYCEYHIDNLGNIIAFKKGKKTPDKKVMIASHMDEVGFIITSITSDGYLKFTAVGGIDPRTFFGVSVKINNIFGVIGGKAMHQIEDRDKAPAEKEMFIDIGAKDKQDAEKYVSQGDFAYFDSDFVEFGDGFIKSKALDDRIGCKIMIDLIKSDLEYDAYFTFNVQEEVGLRGAKASAYTVDADIALVIESTTAADLSGVTGENKVCSLGDGAVVSFMDGRTIYDKNLYKLAFETAKENDIKCQTKSAVAGGNDSGVIHTSRNGVKTISISVPCRYIHTASSVVKKSDIDCVAKLTEKLLGRLYD